MSAISRTVSNWRTLTQKMWEFTSCESQVAYDSGDRPQDDLHLRGGGKHKRHIGREEICKAKVVNWTEEGGNKVGNKVGKTK